jgi:hypothetical protein
MVSVYFVPELSLKVSLITQYKGRTVCCYRCKLTLYITLINLLGNASTSYDRLFFFLIIVSWNVFSLAKGKESVTARCGLMETLWNCGLNPIILSLCNNTLLIVFPSTCHIKHCCFNTKLFYTMLSSYKLVSQIVIVVYPTELMIEWTRSMKWENIPLLTTAIWVNAQ